MKPRISDSNVRQRIPKGCELPTRFGDFVRAEPPFPVEWNSLVSYGLKRSAMKEVIPFLHLPDGGLVAFWYHAASPAIVYIGAHGEQQVIAHEFDDFLKGIGAKCSGLPDFDDDGAVFCVPGLKGKPNKKRLVALKPKFEQWFKKHTSLLEPTVAPDAEAIRQRVLQISERMLRDGCSKVYTIGSTWWSMDFQIERTEVDLTIAYLDYGKWYPVAENYGLRQEVTALLELVKHKKRRRYELSTCSAGIVSIDRDRELVLAPPELRE